MQYGNFNTASGIIQKQSFLMVATIAFIALFQYRKRYGPVATVTAKSALLMGREFQYRKRYGPVATKRFRKYLKRQVMMVSIPQAVWPSCNLDRWRTCSRRGFQYRKRYYPVATWCNAIADFGEYVSIPQAVLPSCNRLLVELWDNDDPFQYRKRYYPVATIGRSFPIWEKLERTGVSIPQAVLPSCNLENG